MIRDVFNKTMPYVFYNFELKLALQLLQGESFVHKTNSVDNNAILVMKANGLWMSKFSRCFFDVKIFDPFANPLPKISAEAYKYHESLKCLKYEQQILDLEKSYFVSIVFSCMSGAGPSAKRTIKQLASEIAEKKTEPYSDAIEYARE